MDALVFYLTGIVALAASILVVTRRNPVYSAIYLVLFFTMVSIQFLVLRAPFLAVIQVLVYGGAIMVLFLFVLMLLNLTAEELEENVTRARKIGAGLGSFALFVLLASTVANSSRLDSVQQSLGDGGLTAATAVPDAFANAGEIEAVAKSLFTDHLLPFELTSFLILIAIIGAVYLTKSRDAAPTPAQESAETTGVEAEAGADGEAAGTLRPEPQLTEEAS